MKSRINLFALVGLVHGYASVGRQAISRAKAKKRRQMQIEAMERRELLTTTVFQTSLPIEEGVYGPGDRVPLMSTLQCTDTGFTGNDVTAPVTAHIFGDDSVFSGFEYNIDVDNDGVPDSPSGNVAESFSVSQHGELTINRHISIFDFIIGEGSACRASEIVGVVRDDLPEGGEWRAGLTPTRHTYMTAVDEILTGRPGPYQTISTDVPQNQAPVAEDDYHIHFIGDTRVYDIHNNDFDPDGEPLDLNATIISERTPSEFVDWNYDNNIGRLTVTVDPGYNTDDTLIFDYTIFDDDGASDSAIVAIAVPAEFHGLDVTLSDQNPVQDTVPRDSVYESMVVTVSTGASQRTLEQLTFVHEGLAPTSDVDGVALFLNGYQNGHRVTRVRQVDSEDRTVDLRFNEPLVIAPYSSVDLGLVVDLAPDALVAGERNFVLELPSDVTSDSPEISGAFPLRGDTFRTAAVNSGVVTITGLSVTPNNGTVGDAFELGRFQKSVNGTEDQTAYRWMFENLGTVTTFDDVYLERTDGTVLSAECGVIDNGQYIDCGYVPPFTTLEGDLVTVAIVGRPLEAGSVQLSVEEAMDAQFVGALYGYGINGQNYGSGVEIVSASEVVDVNGGEFTITIDGPVSQTYSPGDHDAVHANVEFVASQDTLVEDLFFQIVASDQNGSRLPVNIHEMVEGVEIRDLTTGRTEPAVRLIGGTSFDLGRQIYRVSNIIVGQGIEGHEIRWDYIDNGVGHPRQGDRFYVEMCTSALNFVDTCTFTGTSAQATYNVGLSNLATGDPITDSRPGDTIRGNNHQIVGHSATFTELTGPSVEIIVENQRDVEIASFAMSSTGNNAFLSEVVYEVSANGAAVNLQNYTLVVDANGNGVMDNVGAPDGDRVLESGVASNGNRVIFSDLSTGGWERDSRFWVLADGASQFSSSFFSYSLVGVVVEDADDGDVWSADRITIVNTNQPTIDTRPQGSLFVTLDNDIPPHQQAILGEQVYVGSLEFVGVHEPIDITDLQFSFGTATSSVRRVNYRLENETDWLAFATVGGCGNDLVDPAYPLTMCANMESRQLVVDGVVVVEVWLETWDDANGGVQGDTVTTYVSNRPLANEFTGEGAVRARGDWSSNDLLANDEDALLEGEIIIGSNQMGANQTIEFAPVTLVGAGMGTPSNGLADADGSAVPVGQSDIGAIRFPTLLGFNPDSGQDDALVDDLILNNIATHVEIATASIGLYNNDDPTTIVPATAITTLDGTPITTPTVTGEFLSWYEDISITLDTDVNPTLVQEANVTNPNTSTMGESALLNVFLTNFSDPNAGPFGAQGSHIVWSNVDGNQATNVDMTWIQSSVTTVPSTVFTDGEIADLVQVRDVVHSVTMFNGGVILPLDQFFPDMTAADPDFGVFSDATQEGWFVGFNGLARPDSTITILDSAQIIARAFALTPDPALPTLHADPSINALMQNCGLLTDIDANDDFERDQYFNGLVAVDQGFRFGADCDANGLTPAAEVLVADAVDAALLAGFLRD